MYKIKPTRASLSCVKMYPQIPIYKIKLCPTRAHVYGGPKPSYLLIPCCFKVIIWGTDNYLHKIKPTRLSLSCVKMYPQIPIYKIKLCPTRAHVCIWRTKTQLFINTMLCQGYSLRIGLNLNLNRINLTIAPDMRTIVVFSSESWHSYVTYKPCIHNLEEILLCSIC